MSDSPNSKTSTLPLYLEVELPPIPSLVVFLCSCTHCVHLSKPADDHGTNNGTFSIIHSRRFLIPSVFCDELPALRVRHASFVWCIAGVFVALL